MFQKGDYKDGYYICEYQANLNGSFLSTKNEGEEGSGGYFVLAVGPQKLCAYQIMKKVWSQMRKEPEG